MNKLLITVGLIASMVTLKSMAHEASPIKTAEPQICKCKEKLAELENKVQRQYKPFNHVINGVQLIIYPVKDNNPLQAVYDPKDKKQMLSHIEALYAKHSTALSKGNYHILFVWNLNGKRMTDVWVHNIANFADADSGPLLDNYVFKDLGLSKDAGIASGDSIIVLGREEELRRQLGAVKVQEYANREKHMPEFPKGMVGTTFFS